MSATDLELRKKVQNYVNSADHKLLKLMEAIAESYQEGKVSAEPTETQKIELDKRLKRYAQGDTEFLSWEEIEAKIK